MTQNMTTPSLDAHSAQFNVSGPTPYSNALWWKQLPTAPNATHFVYDFWVYVTDARSPQSLEFDLNQTVNGTKYIFGTQCDFKDSGKWDVWDGGTNKWVPSPLNCALFQPYSWNHFTWNFERVNDQVHYISLAINGVTYPVNIWENPEANVDAQELNVAVQLDGDYAQHPYSIWVNKASITYW
jgi:hypothetical protein